MTLHKPEWFKVDPSKFLSDSQVDAMTTEELGACFRLLCRQWIDGFIPDDLHLLARLCRLDASGMAQAWVTLCPFFPVTEEGKRANRFMWIERDRVLSELARKSDEGTRAANKRWDEVRKNRDAEPIGSPMPHPMQDQTRIRPDQTREEKPPSRVKACLSVDDLAWFEKAWGNWPSVNQKDGSAVPVSSKAETMKRFQKILKADSIPAEVLAYACGLYYMDRESDGIYLKAMQTFLGPQRAWADYIERAKAVASKRHTQEEVSA